MLAGADCDQDSYIKNINLEKVQLLVKEIYTIRCQEEVKIVYTQDYKRSLLRKRIRDLPIEIIIGKISASKATRMLEIKIIK